jgi:hypothetical protein
MAQPSKLAELIEPAACTNMQMDAALVFELSKAISLRRIADLLEGKNDGHSILEQLISAVKNRD